MQMVTNNGVGEIDKSSGRFHIMVFSVELATGELIPTGIGETPYEPLDQPHRKLPITYEQYKKIARPRNCGRCKRELDVWEINVGITDYYAQNKRGRIKFICFGCAQRLM